MIDGSLNKIVDEINFVFDPLKVLVFRIRSDSDRKLMVAILRISLECVILRCFDKFAKLQVPFFQQYLFDLSVVYLNFGFEEGHQQK